MFNFDAYTPRRIDHKELLDMWGWRIKVYTVTNKEQFLSGTTLNEVVLSLPKWIHQASSSQLATYNTAFLIVHEAREGVWILFNWWTGGEMIETRTFFSDPAEPANIYPSPHKNSLVCVWELEIFAHERSAWIKHILSKNKNPDFENYFSDYIRTKI